MHGYDTIAFLNDFDSIDTFSRALAYAKELCPQAQRITFGRLSKLIPDFFRTLDLDAVVESGDYEAGMDAYWCAGAAPRQASRAFGCGKGLPLNRSHRGNSSPPRIGAFQTFPKCRTSNTSGCIAMT